MKAYKGFHWYEFYMPFVRYMGLPGRYVRDALNIPFPLHREKGYRPNNGRNRNEPIPFDELSMTQEDIGISIGVLPAVPQGTSHSTIPACHACALP